MKFYVVNGLEYGYKPFKFRWDVSRYVGAAVEKPLKPMIFTVFCPGLLDSAADCLAPCGPIWLIFCLVKGLEYGYKLFKFRWDASMYVGAAVEKPSKTDDFRCFLPGVSP